MNFVDSNVWIAALVAEHVHNAAARRFLRGSPASSLATAAHCLSEAYSQLTRASGPFCFDPRDAAEQVQLVAANVTVHSLSAAQTRDAIQRFAATRGIGPRLYDYLIGATAVAHGADTVVTWNVRHFAPLFPHLRVVTPAELTP